MSVAFMTETGEIVDREPETVSADEPPAPRRTVRAAERAAERPAKRERKAREPRAKGSRWRVAFWVLLGLTILSHSAPEAASVPLSAFPACETEDSDMCLWNAAEQGNGLGTSFVSIAGTRYAVTP